MDEDKRAAAVSLLTQLARSDLLSNKYLYTTFSAQFLFLGLSWYIWVCAGGMYLDEMNGQYLSHAGHLEAAQ